MCIARYEPGFVMKRRFDLPFLAESQEADDSTPETERIAIQQKRAKQEIRRIPRRRFAASSMERRSN